MRFPPWPLTRMFIVRLLNSTHGVALAMELLNSIIATNIPEPAKAVVHHLEQFTDICLTFTADAFRIKGKISWSSWIQPIYLMTVLYELFAT